MIKILQYLFFGYVHKWKVTTYGNLEVTDLEATGIRCIMQCVHCGKIKKKDLY